MWIAMNKPVMHLLRGIGVGLIGGLLMMSNITASAADTSGGKAQDEARIRTIVEAVGVLIDLGNFAALESLYADEVKMDYTSLTGGEVEVKTAVGLMTEWASLVPGFDLTRHAVSNIRVQVDKDGDGATATTDVVGDHWVGELFWRAAGSYRYRLARDGAGAWRITAHQFNLKDEVGTRDVFGLASANAQANPVAYIRQQTR